MGRKSARILGESLGMTAAQVNKALEKLGFIEKSMNVTLTGSPTWEITEKGKTRGGLSQHPYGNFIWDDDVIDDIMSIID